MNRRAFATLAAAAVILIVLAYFGQGRDGDELIAGASAGSVLFQGLETDLDRIDGITVTGAGNERLVSLERVDDAWTVAELGSYPADRSRINGLLITIAEATIVEEKTADPAFHARLGVEDIANAEAGGLEVALTAEGGSGYAAILGDGYSGTERYARLAGADQSVLIDRNPTVSSDPADWVDKTIIDIAAERIQRVEITHADGETLVIRKQARTDRDFAVDDVPADRELQYAGVANVTGNLLAALELEAVAPAGNEPGETIATVVFSAFDGLVVTVTAETTAEDTGTWLRFAADFDAAQAGAFAVELADDDEPEPASEASDVAAGIAAINARLSGWRYRIASYQLSQLTRRIEDLLRPEADE